MPSSSVRVVRDTLQNYARRGIFRQFGETGSVDRKTVFQFNWLTNVPLTLVYDSRRRTLLFKDLLPRLPAESALYDELKTFVQGFHSMDLVEHRRLDPKRALVTCSNEDANASLVVKVTQEDYAYAISRALFLVNEIFQSFLTLKHCHYMVDNFGLSEE